MNAHVALTRGVYNSPDRTIARVEISHAGRAYVAIRYRGGRVELYQVQDGLETFLRYARPSRGAIDRVAIRRLADTEDPAATEARAVLSGAYGSRVRNVEVLSSPTCGPWGTVKFEFFSEIIGRWYPRACSVRLFNKIAL